MWSRIFKIIWFLAAKCLHCFWKWNLGLWLRILVDLTVWNIISSSTSAKSCCLITGVQNKKKSQSSAVSHCEPGEDSSMLFLFMQPPEVWGHCGEKLEIFSGVVPKLLLLHVWQVFSGVRVLALCLWTDELSHSSPWKGWASGAKESPARIWEAPAVCWCNTRKKSALGRL